MSLLSTFASVSASDGSLLGSSAFDSDGDVHGDSGGGTFVPFASPTHQRPSALSPLTSPTSSPSSVATSWHGGWPDTWPQCRRGQIRKHGGTGLTCVHGGPQRRRRPDTRLPPASTCGGVLTNRAGKQAAEAAPWLCWARQQRRARCSCLTGASEVGDGIMGVQQAGSGHTTQHAGAGKPPMNPGSSTQQTEQQRQDRGEYCMEQH